MTQHNRPPKLYVTSDFIEMAHDENITGATAHNSAHEVIQRGSEGSLRGLSVSRLVLHTSANIEDSRLKVFRVPPYEHSNSFVTSERPGIHPDAFIAEGLPEVHSLVVPIKEADPTATAWALHSAAARYGQGLGLPRAGERELRAPTEGFGVPGLNAALDTGLHLLGGIINKNMPKDKRETPEELAAQLRKGILPIIGRGVDAIRAVQDLPDGSDTSGQSPISPLTPAEMATLVDQEPPIFFHTNG